MVIVIMMITQKGDFLLSQTLYINKNKQVGRSKQPIVHSPVLEFAQLKYGRAIAVPKTENHEVMIFTEDTGELFIGQGSSVPIKKLSSVRMFDSVKELPMLGVKDCLYIAMESNSMHFWDGKKYQVLNGVGNNSRTDTVLVSGKDDYEDVFHVGEDEIKSEFKLTHKPVGKIRMYIDGIRYFKECIEYDAATNIVKWTNGSDKLEGFDINDADVVFEYDYEVV